MDKRGITLCKVCRDRYEDAKAEYCDFCGMEASICSCVPQLLLMSGCADYRKLAFYKTAGEANAFRSMIYSIKRSYNLALMRFFSKELVALDADGMLTDPIVTYIPRSRKAHRTYGYDQGKLLAKFYAQAAGDTFAKLFQSRLFRRQQEQKLLNFNQRAANIRGAYILTDTDKVRGRDIILVDDVVTSGATVAECAAMLYAAGAKNVSVRSVAYTYRKNKHKKD